MDTWLVALIAAGALLLSGLGGVPVVRWALAAATRAWRARSVGGDGGGDEAARVLRGGSWIGVLERVAITGSILLGHPEGIAIVVAIKGLGRYPELRSPHHARVTEQQSDGAGAGSSDGESDTRALGAAVSERFIIGTLVSFLLACGVGALGRWLVG